MSTQPIGKDSPQATDVPQEAIPAVGLVGKIQGEYRRIKEHAEAYPYVWGSYIIVYGTLGFWLTYRWRKLRQTEDRVRVLQEKLRLKFEAEQSIKPAAVPEQSEKSASLANKAAPSADK